MLRIPQCLDNWFTDGLKAVSPMHQLSKPQGLVLPPEGLGRLKNSPHEIVIKKNLKSAVTIDCVPPPKTLCTCHILLFVNSSSNVLPVLVGFSVSDHHNVFWVVTLCGLDTVQHFRGRFCLDLQGQRVHKTRNQ
jgi:hypothetical protein